MRALIQRVSSARVEVAGEVAGAIDRGLVVLLGVAVGDTADQARTLAMSLGRRFSVPVRPDLLERARPTRPQAGLSAAARRRNVRGAFRAGRGRVPARITLVDDVLTTGATTAAAAGALRRAGARDVELWCLARAGDQR